MAETDDDEASLQAWQEFLMQYARGDWPASVIPPMPLLTAGLQRQLDTSATLCQYGRDNPDVPLYTTTTIDRDMARRIREFYCRHAYLPPPRAPLEQLRERAIEEYDLYGAQQIAHIQSACELIAVYFPGTICTFSLFHDRIQTHFALAGALDLIALYQLRTGLRIPSEDSLCGHAVLLSERIMFIPDLVADWRYRQNPFVMAGFKSFIGSAVTLKTDPANPDSSALVGVGTLNICFTHAHLPELSTQQRTVINRVTDMLQTQLRSTWDGHNRTREALTRRAVADLIEMAFVASPRPVVDAPQPANGNVPGQELLGLGRLAKVAVSKFSAVLAEVDTMCLIDLRSLRANDPSASKLRFHVDTLSPDTVAVLASTAEDWPEPPPVDVILDFLHRDDPAAAFLAGTAQSGFEPHLPVGTRLHVALPFISGSLPMFLVLATSRHPRFHVEAVVSALRSMGSILRGRAIQDRVKDADDAKTAFLSLISHELRTPLHAVVVGLELIRNAVDDRQWDKLESVLAVTESSGHSLQTILNDVLDFGARLPADKRAVVKVVDLEQVARNAAVICATQHMDSASSASLLFEHERRDWTATVNEAGFSRILVNALTNAAKFCKDGAISLSLTMSDDMASVIVRVTDAGIGFDEAELPHLLKPFTKSDIYSPGAGLGLNITKNLVDNMGGALELRSSPGQGTSFEVRLPITLRTVDARQPRELVRETISQLQRLAAPGTQANGHGNNADAAPGVRRGSDDGRPAVKALSAHLANLSATPPPAPDDVPDALRVMVVDDNTLCRKILTMGLKRCPARVVSIEAADGRQAVERFAEFRPHLVLTDIGMPVMNGIVAAGHMRKICEADGFACEIYALTGLGSSDPRMRSDGMTGASALDGWLIKGESDMKKVYEIIAGLPARLAGSAAPAAG